MATVNIPVWQETYQLQNHVPFIVANVSGGGIGGDSVFFQVAEQQATDEIIITVNGGVLPATDDKISLIAPNGVVPDGGAFGWTADRVSSPNKIILAVTPVEPIDILIQIAVPA